MVPLLWGLRLGTVGNHAPATAGGKTRWTTGDSFSAANDCSRIRCNLSSDSLHRDEPHGSGSVPPAGVPPENRSDPDVSLSFMYVQFDLRVKSIPTKRGESRGINVERRKRRHRGFHWPAKSGDENMCVRTVRRERFRPQNTQESNHERHEIHEKAGCRGGERLWEWGWEWGVAPVP